MFKLLKSRRGQIRGIDFSLAMIIFVLTMTQILVLTSNFISSNRSFQGINERQVATEGEMSEIMSSPGGLSGQADWSNVSTSQLNASWVFGLANDHGDPDPYKIGRLSNWSLIDYLIDYQKIKDGSNLDNDFRIEILNSIDISIDSMVYSSPDVLINGSVTQNAFPVSGASVKVYLIDDTENVLQQDIITGQNGLFTTSFTPASDGYFISFALVSYGVGNQDIDYNILGNTISKPISNPISLFKSYTGNAGYNVNVTTVNQLDDPNSVDYFVFSESNYSTVLNNPTQVGNNWINNIIVPTTGLVSIMVLESDGLDQYISIVTFPLIIDGQISNIIEPPTPPTSQTTVISKNIMVRGVLMEFRFTRWL